MQCYAEEKGLGKVLGPDSLVHLKTCRKFAPDLYFLEQKRVLVDRRRRSRYVTDTITDGRVTSAVVPGFWVEAAWLWAEPLPKVMQCLRTILGDGGKPA
jgi:hypothetical protein